MNYETCTTTHIYYKSIDNHLTGSLFTGPKIIKQEERPGSANLWYTIYANACLASKRAKPVSFTLAEQEIIKEAFTPGTCLFDKHSCWVNFRRTQ